MYIANLHRNAEYHILKAVLNIEEGTLVNDNVIHYGIKTYMIPVGNVGFINRWLNLKSIKIADNLDETEELLDPTAISPQEVLSSQCLWLLP